MGVARPRARRQSQRAPDLTSLRRRGRARAQGERSDSAAEYLTCIDLTRTTLESRENSTRSPIFRTPRTLPATSGAAAATEARRTLPAVKAGLCRFSPLLFFQRHHHPLLAARQRRSSGAMSGAAAASEARSTKTNPGGLDLVIFPTFFIPPSPLPSAAPNPARQRQARAARDRGTGLPTPETRSADRDSRRGSK